MTTLNLRALLLATTATSLQARTATPEKSAFASPGSATPREIGAHGHLSFIQGTL